MRKLLCLRHDLKYDHYVHLTTKCQVLKLQLSDKEEGEGENLHIHQDTCVANCVAASSDRAVPASAVAAASQLQIRAAAVRAAKCQTRAKQRVGADLHALTGQHTCVMPF